MRTSHLICLSGAFFIIAGCPPDGAGDDDTAGADPDWVSIPGGTYDMGSNEGQDDELPVHSVTVPTFEMLRTEVTVSEYGACVDAGGCSEPGTEGSPDAEDCNWNDPGYEDHPVNCVDWDQSVAFCSWAGGRLPSESEWEYAARSGGQDITYPWGNEEATCDYAVMYDDTHGYGCDTERTWPVCSKTAGNTDQGLCDMVGNAWEWVQDWHHSSYDAEGGAPDDGSAWEDSSDSHPSRVLRGGCFWSGARDLRAANRAEGDFGAWACGQGFRCAR